MTYIPAGTACVAHYYPAAAGVAATAHGRNMGRASPAFNSGKMF
jgi:hypothetical protein